MGKTLTFLQLSEEFGGTKFGPFQGVEIRLGSDPSRNDITLPEALGVSPEHIKILIQQDDSYIIAPVERTATVYIWRASSNKPKQITTPMAVTSGDGFSLVTPEGPRFYLSAEMPHQIDKADPKLQGPGFKLPAGQMPSSRGIIAEIKRRGFASVFTSKAGNQAMRAWTFIKTGQIFSPMYIVGAMTVMSGWVFAGGASCAALSFNSSKANVQTELTDCRDQLGVGEEGSEPTVPGLVEKILGDLDWNVTMQGDNELKNAFAKELRLVFEDSDRYKWVYKEKRSPFVDFHKQLERQSQLPAPLVRVLAYVAAEPGFVTERDWKYIAEASNKKPACGRGPLVLTFRQANQLGLTPLQLDAAVERDVADSNDMEKIRPALEGTARSAGLQPEFAAETVEVAGLQGQDECVFLEGDDQRTDVKEIATALGRQIGKSAKGLPPEQSSYWIASRLVKFYTTDYSRGFEKTKFRTGKSPTVNLEMNEDITSDARKYAINNAARVIARAVAIPCLAVLDKEMQGKEPKHMGDLPNLGQCAILKTFVEYNRF